MLKIKHPLCLGDTKKPDYEGLPQHAPLLSLSGLDGWDRLNSINLGLQEPMVTAKVRGKPVTLLLDSEAELSPFKIFLCQKLLSLRQLGFFSSSHL